MAKYFRTQIARRANANTSKNKFINTLVDFDSGHH
jgi:hypothetical protein